MTKVKAEQAFIERMFEAAEHYFDDMTKISDFTPPKAFLDGLTREFTRSAVAAMNDLMVDVGTAMKRASEQHAAYSGATFGPRDESVAKTDEES